MPEQRNFNIETAAEDFAGPGRSIKIRNERTDYRPRRQMKLTVNDWTFSAIWGFGGYCTGARAGGGYSEHPPPSSPDAEVAVWKGDGPMIKLHGDTVEGWVSPAAFLAAVEAAERDDEAGIRDALRRSDA